MSQFQTVKPPSGTPIDWSSPLAPRSKTGIFLPFNGGGSLPVDLVQNAQFYPYSHSVYHNGCYQPVGPGQFTNNQSIRLYGSTSPTGEPTIYQAPGVLSSDCTIACIFKEYTVISDGPRLIGTGDNNGIELEPGHGGIPQFSVLYGTVAHIGITIPYTLGHWYFFGISTRQSGLYFDSFVFDYDTCQSYSTTVNTGGNYPSYPGGGTFQVGGDEGGSGSASDASMYWGLIDYAYWSVQDMSRLAANPWGFMKPAAPVKSRFCYQPPVIPLTNFAPGNLQSGKVAYYAY
jgi:hypothetical protein